MALYILLSVIDCHISLELTKSPIHSDGSPTYSPMQLVYHSKFLSLPFPLYICYPGFIVLETFHKKLSDITMEALLSATGERSFSHQTNIKELQMLSADHFKLLICSTLYQKVNFRTIRRCYL